MNESFGYQERRPGPSSPDSPTPLQGPYKFTAEELKVLGECNRESFYQRSLPFATVLGLGTFAAVSRGFLKPNLRFGAAPKVALATIVGYFLGKVSYQEECAKKLMNLQGSYLGQLLRERKGISGPPPNEPPPFPGAEPRDVNSEYEPRHALDYDITPNFSPDSFGSVNDHAEPATESPVAARPGLSYDDLRQKNRGTYNNNKQDPYRMEGAPPIVRARAAPPTSTAPRATNQYGDTVD